MSFKIIDAHMHMGDSTKHLSYDNNIQTLIAQMDYLGIERAISSHTFSLKDQFALGAAMDAKAHEETNGRIFSFFCFGPRHPQAALDVIRANKDNPIYRGIKIHPSGSNIDADSEAYRPVWDIARELHYPILSHTWNISTYNPSQKSAFAGKFEKYVSEYPDVTFIFGHSGGRWDGVKEAVRIGKAHKNCYFDIAGDISGAGVLDYLVDNVGADRIIYGSDCYMIEHRPMLGVILGSALTGAQKEKILRYNALKVYFGGEE